MKKLFKAKTLTVADPEHPGVWLTVRRNWWQRLLYPRRLATEGELFKIYREIARDWEEEYICGC